MQSDNNFSKRFINYISHVGVVLILLVAFPLESCFENYSIAPKKELAINKLEPANKKQRNHVLLDLDDKADTFSENLDINSPSVEQETQEIIIHSDPAVQDPTFSRIPSYISSTSTDNVPSVSGNQGASSLSSNNISGDLVTTTPSLTSTKEQKTSPSNVFPRKEKAIQARQAIAKQQRESRIIDLEKQLEGQMFKTRQGGYTVKFYKEKETWWAEVTDLLLNKKFLLPAHLDNIAIEHLAKLAKVGQTTTGLIQVVLSNSFQEGYVYIGGLEGGMNGKRGGNKKQGDEKKDEKQGEKPNKRLAKRTKGKEKKVEGEEEEEGATEVIIDRPTSEEASGLYKEAEEIYTKFTANANSKKTSAASKKLHSAVELYKQAASLGHKEAQERLIKLRNTLEPTYKKAVVNLNIAAMEKYEQAVYKEGSLLVDTESESSSDGGEGMSDEEREEKRNKLTFAAFNNRAEQRLKELAKEQKSNKKIIAPKQLRSMRLSNLIVMDLDVLRAPARIEWGGNYIDPAMANSRNLFGPLFDMPNTEEYEHGVLAIDPSGPGTDETGYCVAKRYKDYYFVLDVGGFGGTGDKDKERKGHSNKILNKLIEIANQYKVNTIFIENNFDPSLKYRLKERLLEKGLGFIRVIDDPQKGNKQKRIVEMLSPLLKKHQIIMAQRALESDFESNPENNLHYKFFYQLMAIESTSSSTTTALFQGNPTHDDRVDAVAIAIEYLGRVIK